MLSAEGKYQWLDLVIPTFLSRLWVQVHCTRWQSSRQNTRTTWPVNRRSICALRRFLLVSTMIWDQALMSIIVLLLRISRRCSGMLWLMIGFMISVCDYLIVFILNIWVRVDEEREYQWKCLGFRVGSLLAIRDLWGRGSNAIWIISWGSMRLSLAILPIFTSITLWVFSVPFAASWTYLFLLLPTMYRLSFRLLFRWAFSIGQSSDPSPSALVICCGCLDERLRRLSHRDRVIVVIGCELRGLCLSGLSAYDGSHCLIYFILASSSAASEVFWSIIYQLLMRNLAMFIS